MHGFMGRCSRWCHNKAVGVLVLRLMLGVFFLGHGISKFQNMEMMKGFFGSLGLPPWTAIVVACAEVFSGAALVLGAFLWIAAPLITIIMLVAAWKVGAKYPGDALTTFIAGWGPNLVYAAAALCLAFCGAGRYSLTAWYLRRKGMQGDCRDGKASHGIGHDCPDCPPEHQK